MKQLDLNLEDEPYEIKMDDVERDDTEGKENIEKRFKLNLEVVRKIDIKIKFAIIGTVVSFLGSFFSFWGVKVEGLGRLDYGNLMNGYKIGGIMGKIFIFSIIATVVLMYINQKKYALISDLVSVVAFLIQIIIILIWGKGSYDEIFHISIYFGIGFYICLIGILITTYFTYSNYKKSIIKK